MSDGEDTLTDAEGALNIQPSRTEDENPERENFANNERMQCLTKYMLDVKTLN